MLPERTPVERLGKEGDWVTTIEQPLPLASTGLGTADAFLIIDSEGRIRLAGGAAVSLLGYEPGAITTMHLTDLWYARPPLGWARNDGRPQVAEMAHASGEALPVRLTAVPLSGGDPGDQLLTLVREDERAHLNELLLHAQRLSGIGTLTASVAHELASPLSIITASLANLADEQANGELSPEQVTRYIEMMQQSADRAARIIEVLRHYTHNDDELSVAVTSADDILRDALVMVEQQFRKRAHVEVEAAIEGDLDTIVADHNRLTQGLINLLLNARDAMQPDGGTIRVRFWPLAATSAAALLPGSNGSSPRDYFAFSVCDSGPGIPPETLDHLFEPFYTTKPSGLGTGLGLFISQGIVEQHNGRIWAENNPDGGATFIVVLPKRPK
jgi:signal transduction histidine kinase